MPAAAKPLPFLTDNDIVRFWSKVAVTENEDECWDWEGSICYGYGHFKVGNGIVKAHRISYFLEHKKDPGELLVCHTCDNRKCCNPKHYFLGTNEENMDDMESKGRGLMLKGEKHFNAMLTESIVKSIREKYLTGNITQASLSREFGIDRRYMSDLVNNKRWKHI